LVDAESVVAENPSSSSAATDMGRRKSKRAPGPKRKNIEPLVSVASLWSVNGS
jgi:hypothetical protein